MISNLIISTKFPAEIFVGTIGQKGNKNLILEKKNYSFSSDSPAFAICRLFNKGNPLTLLVGMWVNAATMEDSVEFPQKPKNRNLVWSIWFSNYK